MLVLARTYLHVFARIYMNLHLAPTNGSRDPRTPGRCCSGQAPGLSSGRWGATRRMFYFHARMFCVLCEFIIPPGGVDVGLGG